MVIESRWRIAEKPVDGWRKFTAEAAEVENEAYGFIAITRPEYAKLIAASPEMLTVLRTSRGNLSRIIAACNCSTYNVWLAEIDRVIAKAEGEQQ